MGVVYLVRADGALGALKLIRPEFANDPGFRGRFAREVEASKAVESPFVARVIDSSLDEGPPYLVTEHIAGPSLAEVVAAHGPLSFDRVEELGSELARGLEAIHASGIIHRDLKPANVIMSPGGPRIIDFGIARTIDETSMTIAGSMIGSPSWMSPEAASGKLLSPASDTFSWGAVVAFAAMGRSPFGEGRPEAILYRVVHETPDLEGLDPRLVPIISRALARDPSQRPQVSEIAGYRPNDTHLIDLGPTVISGASLIPPVGESDATVVSDATQREHSSTRVNRAAPLQRRKGRATRKGRVLMACGAALLLIALLSVISVVNGLEGGSSKPPVSTTTVPKTTTTLPPPSTITTVKSPQTGVVSTPTAPPLPSPGLVKQLLHPHGHHAG
jgi:serine/threonine protein kinase